MKRVLLFILPLLVGCGDENRLPYNGMLKQIDGITYQYVVREVSRHGSIGSWEALHDPDCPCRKPLAQVRDTLTEWQMLQMAIIFTESRFRSDVTGKNQDGGLYQMTPVFVAEVNRIAGTNYTHEDVYDPDKAIEIFNTMHLFKETDGNFEKALRIHNKSAGYLKNGDEELRVDLPGRGCAG